MIGWLTLIEAEDRARDLPGGDDWSEVIVPVLALGGFEQTTEYNVESNVPNLTGNRLYLDVPFKISSEINPPSGRYVIDRAGTGFDDSEPRHHVLVDDEQRGRFDVKRRQLLIAFQRLCALDAYSITTATPAEINLKAAQLLSAINGLNDATGASFYSALQRLGVKRDRRGDAETEFQTRGDAPVYNMQGQADEVLNYLQAYLIRGAYGAELGVG